MIEQKRFEVMLILLVPDIVELIMDNYTIDGIKATQMFYNSELYSVLEEENTKLWHLSPLMLFTMFDEEQKTGKITFPEEAG
ncbi:hypothetical protein FACS189465_0680 [Clostridia bacterium]|nr:hypothetical protein FACS189465_0680 [Clostridia bacterium]